MADTEYRLVVAGELSNKVSAAFDGMTLTRQAGRTIVHGPVRDQVHLHGLLQRISDLGLTLISAVAVEGPADEAQDRTVGGA